MISSLVRKIQQSYLARSSIKPDTPLLCETELYELQLLANSLPFAAMDTQKQQAQPLIGETTSIYYGQGLEFEENRQYTPGDDPRFINWRLLARTGQMYSKVFRETRRPHVFLVIDRRSRMCFGTRQQLKMTQSARLAVFFIYKALQKQFAVGGLVVDSELHWYRHAQSEAQVQPLLQHVNRQCMPLPFSETQPLWEDVLAQVQHHLSAGNIVILLSDFHDLNRESEPALLNLSRLHQVLSWQILDPIELSLPAQGQYTILQDGMAATMDIDMRDEWLRSRYAELAKQKQQQIMQRLSQTGSNVSNVLTTQDIQMALRMQAYGEH